jgi:hypothetical protein
MTEEGDKTFLQKLWEASEHTNREFLVVVHLLNPSRESSIFALDVVTDLTQKHEDMHAACKTYLWYRCMLANICSPNDASVQVVSACLKELSSEFINMTKAQAYIKCLNDLAVDDPKAISTDLLLPADLVEEHKKKKKRERQEEEEKEKEKETKREKQEEEEKERMNL